MTEAVWRGEDPKPFCAAQALVVAEEKHLGVDAVILAIVGDELPITELIKKRRQERADHTSNVAPSEVQ